MNISACLSELNKVYIQLFIKLNPGSQKVNIQMNSYILQINNLTGVANTSENRITSWDTSPQNPNMTIMLTFL